MPAVPYLIMAGAGMMAMNQFQAGQAQQKAYNANAEMANQEAEANLVATGYKTQIMERDARAMSARQRVLYAKAGVDITSGSPLLIMAEDAGRAAEDRYMTGYAGQVEATKLRNQGNLYRYYGDQAASAGRSGAMATLVSGLGSAGSSYMKGTVATNIGGK
jgi:hypothetical protein